MRFGDWNRDSVRTANQLVLTASPRPTLGHLLRRVRKRNGWTLKQMSDRTGIAFSTLCKVEHDRSSLKYDQLVRISQGLQIPLSELFADGGDSGIAGPLITGRRSIGIPTDASRVNTAPHDYCYLCSELRGKRMIPMIGRIRARSVAEFGGLLRHSGEEYIYVLSGGISVYTDFYAPVVLRSRESIYLDATMGHAYAAEGCEEATVLAVCSSAEEDLVETLVTLHSCTNVTPTGNSSFAANIGDQACCATCSNRR